MIKRKSPGVLCNDAARRAYHQCSEAENRDFYKRTCITNCEKFIVTDCKGEDIRDLLPLLKENGYDVTEVKYTEDNHCGVDQNKR